VVCWSFSNGDGDGDGGGGGGASTPGGDAPGKPAADPPPLLEARVATAAAGARCSLTWPNSERTPQIAIWNTGGEKS